MNEFLKTKKIDREYGRDRFKLNHDKKYCLITFRFVKKIVKRNHIYHEIRNIIIQDDVSLTHNPNNAYRDRNEHI